MKLYGKEWTRRELEARVGRIEQVGGIRRLRASEGPETGVEHIQVRTGAGLTYSVLPSRGLDIGYAEFAGTPVCWSSPCGEVHPSYFEPCGRGWLRTAAGGLLMTCGITQVGTPGEEDGEELGLHGRAHHTPARQVAAEGRWAGDEYKLSVRGQIEEARLFGPDLRLSRTISSTLGQGSITIDDEVENLGFEPAPHMLLYHFNFGFPLLGEETRISLPLPKGRLPKADIPLLDLQRWPPPQAGWREQVFVHEALERDNSGYAKVEIWNPRFPLPGQADGGSVRVCLRWDAHTLPYLVQWRMPGQGMHVLGIEPANCHVEGRAEERRRGSLIMLASGETKRYRLNLSVAAE